MDLNHRVFRNAFTATRIRPLCHSPMFNTENQLEQLAGSAPALSAWKAHVLLLHHSCMWEIDNLIYPLDDLASLSQRRATSLLPDKSFVGTPRRERTDTMVLLESTPSALG